MRLALVILLLVPLFTLAQGGAVAPKAKPMTEAERKANYEREKAERAARGEPEPSASPPPGGLFGLELGETVAIGAALFVFLIIPSVIAIVRGHPRTWIIVPVNLLLGFTGVGWIIALLWSMSEIRPTWAADSQQN